jgi:hypothetical protein
VAPGTFSKTALINRQKAYRYLNKEHLISLPYTDLVSNLTNLAMSPNLIKKVKTFIRQDRLYVYICCNPKLTLKNFNTYNSKKEPVLSFDLSENLLKREHNSPFTA